MDRGEATDGGNEVDQDGGDMAETGNEGAYISRV